MEVKVKWDTDGVSAKKLGLQTKVNIPTMNEENIADYLSDEYGYCVESFTITDLDSGQWEGEDAWVLSDNGHELVLLVGGHTLDVALEVKGDIDSDCPSPYESDVIWVDASEWIRQQDCSDEFKEKYEMWGEK